MMIAQDTSRIQLRPYQARAVREVADRLANGTDRLLLTSPTGSGKTTIASAIITKAAHAGKRVLFMAHRRELIDQAYRRLQEFGLPENLIGVIMAKDPRSRPNAPVQVASVDTLRNRVKPAADVVFIDEAHRATSPSYRAIAEHYDSTFHIGLTATPYRMGGKGLYEAYDELFVVSSPKELIKQGYLVEPRVFTIPESELPDFSKIRTQAGDYREAELSEAVNKKALVGNMVKHWFQYARNVRTVVFAVSVAHSKKIAERFRSAGVAAEHLDGTTPIGIRDSILSRLEKGTTRVVTSCGILSEGWDQPSVKCAILARPTKSTGLYIQQAGRILRPYKDRPAIILDHAGCVHQHGLPHQDRRFSLYDLDRINDGEGAAPTKKCPHCQSVTSRATLTCPSCGAILAVRCDMPEEQAGQLVEIKEEVSISNSSNRLFELRRPGFQPLLVTIGGRKGNQNRHDENNDFSSKVYAMNA